MSDAGDVRFPLIARCAPELSCLPANSTTRDSSPALVSFFFHRHSLPFPHLFLFGVCLRRAVLATASATPAIPRCFNIPTELFTPRANGFVSAREIARLVSRSGCSRDIPSNLAKRRSKSSRLRRGPISYAFFSPTPSLFLFFSRVSRVNVRSRCEFSDDYLALYRGELKFCHCTLIRGYLNVKPSTTHAKYFRPILRSSTVKWRVRDCFEERAEFRRVERPTHRRDRVARDDHRTTVDGLSDSRFGCLAECERESNEGIFKCSSCADKIRLSLTLIALLFSRHKRPPPVRGKMVMSDLIIVLICSVCTRASVPTPGR